MSSQKDNIEIDDTAWVHDSALLFGHISLGRKLGLAVCRHALGNVPY